LTRPSSAITINPKQQFSLKTSSALVISASLPLPLLPSPVHYLFNVATCCRSSARLSLSLSLSPLFPQLICSQMMTSMAFHLLLLAQHLFALFSVDLLNILLQFNRRLLDTFFFRSVHFSNLTLNTITAFTTPSHHPSPPPPSFRVQSAQSPPPVLLILLILLIHRSASVAIICFNRTREACPIKPLVTLVPCLLSPLLGSSPALSCLLIQKAPDAVGHRSSSAQFLIVGHFGRLPLIRLALHFNAICMLLRLISSGLFRSFSVCFRAPSIYLVSSSPADVSSFSL
jgi:hypothetical protein